LEAFRLLRAAVVKRYNELVDGAPWKKNGGSGVTSSMAMTFMALKRYLARSLYRLLEHGPPVAT